MKTEWTKSWYLCTEQQIATDNNYLEVHYLCFTLLNISLAPYRVKFHFNSLPHYVGLFLVSFLPTKPDSGELASTLECFSLNTVVESQVCGEFHRHTRSKRETAADKIIFSSHYAKQYHDEGSDFDATEIYPHRCSTSVQYKIPGSMATKTDEYKTVPIVLNCMRKIMELRHLKNNTEQQSI